MIHEPVLQGARVVVGLLLVAFLPGYLWTRLIWDGMEPAKRVFLAVVLSLSLVGLVVFGLNLFAAVKITLTTTLLVTLFLCALPVTLLARPRIEAALAAWQE